MTKRQNMHISETEKVVTMAKRQNMHISETEKVYDVIMVLFLTKTLGTLHEDFS